MNAGLAALCVFIGLVGRDDFTASKGEFPQPTYPPEAIYRHEQGTLIVAVTFGKNGTVTACRVVDSSGSSILDRHTRSFILSNWKSVALAGQTREGPILYELNRSRETQNVDFPTPPMSISSGYAGKVILNVTFGGDGWVESCEIGKSSGHPALDEGARSWAVAYFHHAAYAGKTIAIPFQFVPGQPPAIKKA